MIGIVIRRKAGAGKAKAIGLEPMVHYEDRPITRGWRNLRGEVTAEMNAYGVNPMSADVASLRGEWRSGT